MSNAQNFKIENLIYLKKFCWCEKICQQKLPICCENNNELHSTNPSNVWKQKTKCGSWNKKASWNRVRPERVRKGRLRRVGKILETRGNFDEIFEIKKSTIFIETKSTKNSQSLPNFFVIESSSKILETRGNSHKVSKDCKFHHFPK